MRKWDALKLKMLLVNIFVGMLCCAFKSSLLELFICTGPNGAFVKGAQKPNRSPRRFDDRENRNGYERRGN